MKFATQKFYYPGIFSHWESCCGLEIIEKENGTVYVIMTELGDNPGTSVTNAVENVATKVYNEYLHHVSIENIFWIEHYNKASYRCPENGKETCRVENWRARFRFRWCFCSFRNSPQSGYHDNVSNSRHLKPHVRISRMRLT